MFIISKPLSQEIFQVYDALSKVPNGFFTIAAAFGNVHGVYQPGNVKLEPTILDKASGDRAGGNAWDRNGFGYLCPIDVLDMDV